MDINDILNQMEFLFENKEFNGEYFENYTIGFDENGIVFDEKFATIYTIPKELQTENLHEILLIGCNVNAKECLEFSEHLNYRGHKDWRIANEEEIRIIKNNFYSYGIDRRWITNLSDRFWYKYETKFSKYIKMLGVRLSPTSAIDKYNGTYNEVLLVR